MRDFGRQGNGNWLVAERHVELKDGQDGMDQTSSVLVASVLMANAAQLMTQGQSSCHFVLPEPVASEQPSVSGLTVNRRGIRLADVELLAAADANSAAGGTSMIHVSKPQVAGTPTNVPMLRPAPVRLRRRDHVSGNSALVRLAAATAGCCCGGLGAVEVAKTAAARVQKPGW